MRIGLVAIGSAFAVVGAAVFVAVLYPADTPTTGRSDAAEVAGLTGGGNWRSFILQASPENPATLSLNWFASAPVNVSWYLLYACNPSPSICAVIPALHNWTGNLSGHWSMTGTANAEYELWVACDGSKNASVNFSATFQEQFRAGPLSLPWVPFVVTLVGASLLAGIGAVALYLGLFLPSGVYAPYAPFDTPAEGDDLDPIDVRPSTRAAPSVQDPERPD